jgi:glucose-1-phosphate adenylyltransferase
VQDVMSVILGGGRGSRLFPLTQYRSKPAVPIGGKYRLIDNPISNCLHSGLESIYVLTQFNSASLHRHLYQTYRFDSFSNGFVEILAAEQTAESTAWYQGTADAVRQQLRHLMSNRARQFLILSGDHLYRMDYAAFVQAHRDSGADLTIAVQPVTRDAAPDLGILKLDESGRVCDFHEKPSDPAVLDDLRIRQDGGEHYPASMGIYVFEREVLVELLEAVPEEDFGRHIIPKAVRTHHVQSYSFTGYWEDIGTMRAFYEANLAVSQEDPPFVFYEPDRPIFTHPRYLAASRLDGCRLTDSVVSEGCNIRDTALDHCIVGIRSLIGPDVTLKRTIVMGADYYEMEADLARNSRRGVPNVGIGERCEIEGAIIDKNARIGNDVKIRSQEGVDSKDGDQWYVREGVVVIPKNGVVPDGTVI